MMQNALLLRATNSLHGFNVWTDDESMILGKIYFVGQEAAPEWAVTSAAIRSALQLKDSEYKGFAFVGGSYAGDLLQIPIALRRFAGTAIDTVRERGYAIKLQTRLSCYYPTLHLDKTPFSKEASEQIAVREFEELFRLAETGFLIKNVLMSKFEQLADPRLWCTQDGKTVALKIEKLCPSEKDKAKTPILGDEFFDGAPCDYDFSLPKVAAATAASAAASATAAAPAAANKS